MAVSREAYVALVQRGDDAHDQETELVTVEYVDGELNTIEMTDGQRITLLAPAEAA
ncbi:MAG: hypothetical protein ACJ768_12835 [Gaiellaceae bacterium]